MYALTLTPYVGGLYHELTEPERISRSLSEHPFTKRAHVLASGTWTCASTTTACPSAAACACASRTLTRSARSTAAATTPALALRVVSPALCLRSCDDVIRDGSEHFQALYDNCWRIIGESEGKDTLDTSALREIADGIVKPDVSEVPEVDPRFVTRATPSAVEALRAEAAPEAAEEVAAPEAEEAPEETPAE